MNLNNLNLPPERRKALEQVLDQAWKDYQDNLTNLTDAAADEIETVLERDPLNARETVREYTAAANRLADDYYATVRTAWAEYAGVTMPDFDPGSDLEPERVLWQVQGGFANTDYNGLTYSQVMAGQARSGATIDDLWPSFSNIDDAQQFITDMIRTGARLTERRNIRLDPTKPKWARVPKGPKTCAFCAMLASRGYAYTSEEAAGGKGNIYHADCHCELGQTGARRIRRNRIQSRIRANESARRPRIRWRHSQSVQELSRRVHGFRGPRSIEEDSGPSAEVRREASVQDLPWKRKPEGCGRGDESDVR
jgi:hypothetical protein